MYNNITCEAFTLTVAKAQGCNVSVNTTVSTTESRTLEDGLTPDLLAGFQTILEHNELFFQQVMAVLQKAGEAWLAKHTEAISKKLGES